MLGSANFEGGPLLHIMSRQPRLPDRAPPVPGPAEQPLRRDLGQGAGRCATSTTSPTRPARCTSSTARCCARSTSSSLPNELTSDDTPTPPPSPLAEPPAHRRGAADPAPGDRHLVRPPERVEPDATGATAAAAGAGRAAPGPVVRRPGAVRVRRRAARRPGEEAGAAVRAQPGLRPVRRVADLGRPRSSAPPARRRPAPSTSRRCTSAARSWPSTLYPALGGPGARPGRAADPAGRWWSPAASSWSGRPRARATCGSASPRAPSPRAAWSTPISPDPTAGCVRRHIGGRWSRTAFGSLRRPTRDDGGSEHVAQDPRR